jgi:RNA recognition motif-containing protein
MAGAVIEASLMHDKTGQNLGFAFVTMSSENEAHEATRRFNGISFNGRSLLISEAKQDTRFRPSR